MQFIDSAAAQTRLLTVCSHDISQTWTEFKSGLSEPARRVSSLQSESLRLQQRRTKAEKMINWTMLFNHKSWRIKEKLLSSFKVNREEVTLLQLTVCHINSGNISLSCQMVTAGMMMMAGDHW